MIFAKNVIKYKDAHYVGIAVIHFIIFQTVINPQRACARVTVVSLFVCLSTSDFEDGGVFMFETGINVN